MASAAYGVSAVLSGDAQQPLGSEDDAGSSVLLGAAAPRDELRAEERVGARAERLGRHPVEPAVRADRSDEDLLGHVHVRLDGAEDGGVVVDGQAGDEDELGLRDAQRRVRRDQRHLGAQLRLRQGQG